MLEDIVHERKKKLNLLKDSGANPYPSTVGRTVSLGEAISRFNALARARKKLALVGRVMGTRDQGKLIFADIQDESGKLQVVLKRDNLKNFGLLKDTLDIGDFLSATGVLFKTKSGQKSLEARNASIVVKGLRPLPSEWYGIKDVEERFRKRYLDLLGNSEVKEKFVKRSQMIQYIREFLAESGFLEVETPILQPIPGGALARPFVTHHNALDVDFYLRVAPELYLKRLLVGGFEKIFEIGKDFRNEGMDREHNPEFTMLELYWAYQDYRGLMKFIEKMLKKIIPGKYHKITYEEAFRKYAHKKLSEVEPKDIDDVFKKEVRPKLVEPTFVIEYPKSISPLAKSFADRPEVTERFQLIVQGMEVVNGFSELNDPLDQRARMELQEEEFRAGNPESSRMDEDFLEALEYGMPPAAGLGIGIDRLVTLATKSHAIKEVILFPTLRPKEGE